MIGENAVLKLGSIWNKKRVGSKYIWIKEIRTSSHHCISFVLVVESAHLKMLLFEHYDEICEDVLRIAHHPVLTKNRHIESALLDLLPKLAAFQREIFVTKYLSSTMNYMDRLLQAKDR